MGRKAIDRNKLCSRESYLKVDENHWTNLQGESALLN
jgi:hypothetical protein